MASTASMTAIRAAHSSVAQTQTVIGAEKRQQSHRKTSNIRKLGKEELPRIGIELPSTTIIVVEKRHLEMGLQLAEKADIEVETVENVHGIQLDIVDVEKLEVSRVEERVEVTVADIVQIKVVEVARQLGLELLPYAGLSIELAKQHIPLHLTSTSQLQVEASETVLEQIHLAQTCKLRIVQLEEKARLQALLDTIFQAARPRSLKPLTPLTGKQRPILRPLRRSRSKPKLELVGVLDIPTMRLPVAVKTAFKPHLLNTKALQKLVEKLQRVERLVQVSKQPDPISANIERKRLAKILPFRAKVQLQLVLLGLGGGGGGGNPLLEDMFLARLSAREKHVGQLVKIGSEVIVVEEDLADGINSTSVAEIVDEEALKVYGGRLDPISWRL